MAEIKVKTLDYDEDESGPWTNEQGHAIPHGVEVMIIYRDGCIGTGVQRWNVPPVPGCICPWMDYDPDCPVPVIGEPYYDGFGT